ncbi:hypothetical protein ACFV9C_05025 [Kribbella sp. NPDC059898]|uniref:hypothetical protein n=1 Tax=Kribbella sp. NPDC059898 TaxID=3346995 RepID=UPI0036467598
MTSPAALRVAVVAITTAAAVAAGGAVAHRQGPLAGSSTHAAPLAGTPVPTPTTTPTPTPVVSGPVALDVAKLPQGPAPRHSYRADRSVRGGRGQALKVPGSAQIMDVARLDDGLLAATLAGSGNGELLKLDAAGNVVRRTKRVYKVVGTPDGTAAMYAAEAALVNHEMTYGATLYLERGGTVRSVNLPTVRSISPMAYADGKVYYQASVKGSENITRLYSWSPGDSTVVRVPKIPSAPIAMSADGRLVAASPLAEGGQCTRVVETAGAGQQFRTCDFGVTGFTPDGAVAIGVPTYGEGCSNIVTALNARTAAVIRQWSGCFQGAVAEDGNHLLLLAIVSGGHMAPTTRAAVVRCAIDTGACERATEIMSAKSFELTS